ncbi:MAG: hypothetical protein ACE5FH_11450, partial [Candidatus Zixiibacteriota bacterium]
LIVLLLPCMRWKTICLSSVEYVGISKIKVSAVTLNEAKTYITEDLHAAKNDNMSFLSTQHLPGHNKILLPPQGDS